MTFSTNKPPENKESEIPFTMDKTCPFSAPPLDQRVRHGAFAADEGGMRLNNCRSPRTTARSDACGPCAAQFGFSDAAAIWIRQFARNGPQPPYQGAPSSIHDQGPGDPAFPLRSARRAIRGNRQFQRRQGYRQTPPDLPVLDRCAASKPWRTSGLPRSPAFKARREHFRRKRAW